MISYSSYVILHWMHTSNKTPVDYVSRIVYGNPRIDAVLVGSRGVAIVEYGESQESTARHTFDRMGSFNIGAQFVYDIDVALREFGIWVRHYAPGTIVTN